MANPSDPSRLRSMIQTERRVNAQRLGQPVNGEQQRQQAHPFEDGTSFVPLDGGEVPHKEKAGTHQLFENSSRTGEKYRLQFIGAETAPDVVAFQEGTISRRLYVDKERAPTQRHPGWNRLVNNRPVPPEAHVNQQPSSGFQSAHPPADRLADSDGLSQAEIEDNGSDDSGEENGNEETNPNSVSTTAPLKAERMSKKDRKQRKQTMNPQKPCPTCGERGHVWTNCETECQLCHTLEHARHACYAKFTDWTVAADLAGRDCARERFMILKNAKKKVMKSRESTIARPMEASPGEVPAYEVHPGYPMSEESADVYEQGLSQHTPFGFPFGFPPIFGNYNYGPIARYPLPGFSPPTLYGQDLFPTAQPVFQYQPSSSSTAAHLNGYGFDNDPIISPPMQTFDVSASEPGRLPVDDLKDQRETRKPMNLPPKPLPSEVKPSWNNGSTVTLGKQATKLKAPYESDGRKRLDMKALQREHRRKLTKAQERLHQRKQHATFLDTQHTSFPSLEYD